MRTRKYPKPHIPFTRHSQGASQIISRDEFLAIADYAFNCRRFKPNGENRRTIWLSDLGIDPRHAYWYYKGQPLGATSEFQINQYHFQLQVRPMADFTGFITIWREPISK